LWPPSVERSRRQGVDAAAIITFVSFGEIANAFTFVVVVPVSESTAAQLAPSSRLR
jgi:hypothetical protein